MSTDVRDVREERLTRPDLRLDGANRPVPCHPVQEAKIGPDKDVPHVPAPMIAKHITDLQSLGPL